MEKDSEDTLGFFKNLIKNNGLKRLEIQFDNQLRNHKLRDSRKEYDEENQAYYLFQENAETLEISDESYPVHISKMVEKKINREFLKTIKLLENKVESIPEVDSMSKYLQVKKDEIHTLIEHVNESGDFNNYDFIPRILFALKERIKLLSDIYTLESNTQTKNVDLINEFTHKFSETTEYPKELISMYLEYWVSHLGFSYPRARAKELIKDDGFELPADGTLDNWESKYTKYVLSRTAN